MSEEQKGNRITTSDQILFNSRDRALLPRHMSALLDQWPLRPSSDRLSLFLPLRKVLHLWEEKEEEAEKDKKKKNRRQRDRRQREEITKHVIKSKKWIELCKKIYAYPSAYLLIILHTYVGKLWVSAVRMGWRVWVRNPIGEGPLPCNGVNRATSNPSSD